MAGNMILYIENPEDATRKLVELINEFDKVAGCKINTQISYDYTVEVRNRFKGLDLIDRVPDELWTEVCDIVQETGIKTIAMEKKCKKAKWLSGEALQIAVKRREPKAKEKRKDISI